MAQETEQTTRTEIKLVGRPHKHTWTQAINIEDEGLILFCECGANMDEDGTILQ